MRLLRALGLAAGIIYALLLGYIVSIWTYVSPYAAWAYVERRVDLGESQAPDFIDSLSRIAFFHPSIARVAEAMVAERAPQPDGSTGSLELAEARYRQAARVPGSGQAAAFLRLAGFYVKHRQFGISTGEILRLLQSAYALDYPRAGYEIGRLYELGEGVPQDLDRAAAYYFEVFDGVAEAGIRLAALSREGRIKPPSTRFAADLEARALDLFTKRVEQTGASKSMLALARLYQSKLLLRPTSPRLATGLKGRALRGATRQAMRLPSSSSATIPDSRISMLRAGILEELAGRGNLSAIVKAARMRREGIGGPVDPEGAVTLYQTAVARGSPPAMLKYGEALIAGDGTTRNHSAGMALVAKSASAGDPNAALRLARSFETGVDVPRDPEAALEWYEEAGNLGSRAAMVRLASAYRDGSLVDADPAKYLEWGLKAIEAGATSRSLERDIGAALLGGEGVAANRERGFKLLLSAADQGDGSAALSVARGYAYGVGVTQGATKAVEWYQRAAATAGISAYSELGHAYASGFGVPMNPDLAYEYFGKAASAGIRGCDARPRTDVRDRVRRRRAILQACGRMARQKAADLRNANAMIELANFNRERLVRAASDAAALEWLSAARRSESARGRSTCSVSTTIDGTIATAGPERAEACREAVTAQAQRAGQGTAHTTPRTNGDEM